jgi:parallel beta-helix repeat protein
MMISFLATGRVAVIAAQSVAAMSPLPPAEPAARFDFRSPARAQVEGQVQPLKLLGPVRITTSTRIAPGTYRVAAPAGKAVIEIAADNVTLDLTDVTLIPPTRDTDTPWERDGVGVYSYGHSHISIRGGAIHGYCFGIFIQGGDGDVKVVGSDLSESRDQKLFSTDTHYEERDWVDIFHLDAWESYGAGLYLKDIRGAWIEAVSAHHAQNGVLLANTTHATVYHCDLSHNSGWGIGLFHSSWNDLLDNHADWNVRCEGKTYSAGCDSTGVLLIDASDYNRVIGNSFTHSGDGFFLSKPETGASSDFNYVAFNDGSYSPHNAFESTFSRGEQFYHNLADHSDYGFWLGFSTDTSVIDNHIEHSKRDGIAIEHGGGNILVHNEILRSGAAGIRLFRSQRVPDPSRNYVILDNQITGSPVGILLDQTYDVTITGNRFADNAVGIKAEKGSMRVTQRANQFSPVGARALDADSTSSVEP